MNKSGFTLVELLAVIVLIGVVATVGVTSYSGITNKMKQKMYDSKIEFIMQAAEDYKSDNLNNDMVSSTTVRSLVENGYFEDDEIASGGACNDEICDLNITVSKLHGRSSACINGAGQEELFNKSSAFSKYSCD